MKTVSRLILLLLLVGLAHSSFASINGETWLELQEESKFALLIGYKAGAYFGADSASSKTSKMYRSAEDSTSSSSSEKFEWNTPAADRAWDIHKKVIRLVDKEHAPRHDIADIVEQMDFLYSEPAARKILWFQMYWIAQRRLDGEDVSKAIDSAIKNSSIDSWLGMLESASDIK